MTHDTLDWHPAACRAERLAVLLQRGRGVLVRVTQAQGSVPREAGSWLVAFDSALVGTIGGGHLEHQAIGVARQFLQGSLDALPAAPQRFGLGPALGQCCGGVVHLSFEAVSAAHGPALQAELIDAPRTQFVPVAVFGGGHVGLALAGVLAHLPFALCLIDSRDDVLSALPVQPGAAVVFEHSQPVHAAVPCLAAQSRVLIMSFSHAEDFAVLAACLLRQRTRGDLPFIGLIGSRTKWATFRHQLEARGFTAAELAHVTCPIGVPGVHGKAPEVIAVAVAAQLLQTLPA